jgi:GTP-binding protein
VALPLVTIVGAPNVGKSTLFNRLVGRRRAIVTNEPGATRDRLYGVVRTSGRPFRLVDTGGLIPDAVDVPYAREIERQAEAALEDSAVILFVVDARAGATAVDRDLGRMLRRRNKPLLLVANKIDSEAQEALLGELHDFGLGAPLPMSAEHGRGQAELLERIGALLERIHEAPPPAEAEGTGVRVAIVGRPNVGKSSLLNRLVGEERAVVSELPGTTRDPIDTWLEIGDRRYCLIDTAGIRRRGRVKLRVERFSVTRARRNIERCDVAVLVLDGSREFAAQDAHIAGYVRDAFKPMVVAVNKWDLVERREDAAKRWADRIRTRMKFAKEVPLMLVSARSGQRVTKILDHVDALHSAAGITVPTVELNRWLQEEVAPTTRRAPARGDLLRLYYVTQTGIRPPTFVFFCNDPRRVHFSLRRQLENSLRRRFAFSGAPLRLGFRARRKGRGG